MGGGSDTKEEYHAMHIDAHSWMLAGMNDVDAIATDPTEWDGIAGLIRVATTDSIGFSPYQEVTPFDPSSAESIWPELLESIDSYQAIVDAAAAGSTALTDPETDYGTYADAAVNAYDAEFGTTRINAATAAFETEREAELTADIARYNSALSSINAVNTSSRAIGIALLERETSRQVSKFDADLNLELERGRVGFAMKGMDLANALRTRQYDIVADVDNRRSENILAALQLRSVVAEKYTLSQRTHQEDLLRMSIEDVIWDLRLYDFAAKGLGAIGGASVLPGSQEENKTMSGISQVAGVAGALMAI